MRWTYLLSTLGIGALFGIVFAQPALDSSVPSDAEIRAILADRIDNQRQSVGIVVGIIEPEGRRVIAYGSVDRKSVV